MDIVERLIEAAPIDGIQEMDSYVKRLIDTIERNFHRKLAVWMGISAIGARRFEAVLKSRLIKITDINEPFIEEFLASYKPKLVDTIYREQEKDIASREHDPRTRQQRLNAARIDAAAIDWLVIAGRASPARPGRGGVRRPRRRPPRRAWRPG